MTTAPSQLASIDDPVTYYLKMLGPNSRPTMRYVLQQVAERFGFDDIPITEVPWHSIMPAHVVALREALGAEGYAVDTVKLYMNAVRGVLNAAWVLKLIPRETLDEIRQIKPPRGSSLPRGKNIKRNIIREIMENCSADSRPQGVRDAALIAVLYGSGMRKSESVNIKISDIDFAERCIYVVGKGNRELKKFAPDWVFEKVKAWIRFRAEFTPDAPFLFNRIRKGGKVLDCQITKDGIYHVVKQRGLQAGVSIMPHDFRRSFITRVIDEHDLSIAQKLADHASTATTVRYDMRGEDKKRNVVDGMNL